MFLENDSESAKAQRICSEASISHRGGRLIILLPRTSPHLIVAVVEALVCWRRGSAP